MTESKEMSTELGEVRRYVHGHALKFQALAESMNQGVALLSADGTTLYANSRLGELVGRLPEKMAGTALVEALPSEQRVLFCTLIRELLTDDSEGMSSTGVFRLIGSGGRETPCRLSCVPSVEDGATVIVLTVQTAEGDGYRRIVESPPEVDCPLDRAIPWSGGAGGFCALLSGSGPRSQSREKLPDATEPGSSVRGVANQFNNVFQVIVGYADVCLGIAEEGTPMRGYLQEIVTAVHRGAQMTRQLQSSTTD